MKRLNKKAQFYLVAAIVLVTIVAGFITVANYSKKKNAPTIYDLGEELGIESQNIIDYGTTNEEDIDSLLEDFAESYKDYVGEGKDLYFIFGDSEAGTLKAVSYENSEFVDTPDLNPSGGKVSVTIEDIVYEFDLKEDYGFYFVVSQEINNEKYVITG